MKLMFRKINDARNVIIRKFLRNYYDYGTWIAFKKSLKYLLLPFYQKVSFIIYELDLFTLSPSVESEGLDFKYDRS